MTPEEIRDYLVHQTKFLRKQAKSDDERSNIEWWASQIRNLVERAPRIEENDSVSKSVSNSELSSTPRG